MVNRAITLKKSIGVTFVFSIFFVNAFCQYYYKDLVSVQQINETFRLYKANKINKVTLNSFQGSIPVIEGFIGEQEVVLSKNQVITYTKTVEAGESFFTAFYNPEGFLIKTIDSTQETVSISVYQYDSNNRLFELKHDTRATDNSSSTSEVHFWKYADNTKPQKMVRVKNGSDSTIVNFTTDDQGNISEEEAFQRGKSQGKIYYYYNAKNQLTDVVRYDARLKRLLPDYIFEYEDNGELSTMMIIPEGSTDYQKWYYKYDDTGLKLADFCYNKRNELLGKVEYNYSSNK